MAFSTRVRRYGAQLLTIGAVAVLAAGCGTGPALHGPSASGERSAGGEVQARATGGEDSAPAEGALPQDWSGTVSTQRFAPEDASAYLAMLTLHGSQPVTAMSAEGIEGTEFLAGTGATCEGTAELDGSAATCTFAAMDGSDTTQTAQVRMVSTGFDGTALLFGVSGQGAPDLPVAPGAEHALQVTAENDLSQVTDEDLAEDVTSAVMMGHSHDGELPADLTAECEVADGGEHGTCEVTGTPDEGGDGTWYATAQSGFDGDRAAYLFTRLPQG